jgi:predicted permease
MVPVMLFLLGVHLAHSRGVRVTADVVMTSALRLVVAPALAAVLAGVFGVTGVDRAAGILQAGMPAAVLVSIIALEYRIAPEFVVTSVFFSTLASLPTLTVLLSLV